jgi:hypothetical protein
MVKLSHFSLYCSIFSLGKILFRVFWTSSIYVTISLERDYLVKQGHFSIYYLITWKETVRCLQDQFCLCNHRSGKRLFGQTGSFLYILPYLWERDCLVKPGHFSIYYLITWKEIAGSRWVISLYKINLSLGKRLLGQDGSFLYISPYLWERDRSVSAGPYLFMLLSLWKDIICSNRVISLYITLSLGKRVLGQAGPFLYILPYLWERDCWVKVGHFSIYYLISGKEIAGSRWVISLYITFSLGKRLFGVCWLKWLCQLLHPPHNKNYLPHLLHKFHL